MWQLSILQVVTIKNIATRYWFVFQELSEYLTQPLRDRVGGGSERGDSLERRNNTQDRPHLVGKSWYYGAITRAQCDNLLNQHGHDGDFLIRDSETNVSTRQIIPF